MAPMPTITIRAHAEHHELVRKLAARLKADPPFAVKLDAFLAGSAAGDSDSDTLAARLADIEARLAALEGTARTAPPSRHPAEQRAAPPSPAPKVGANSQGSPSFGAQVRQAREVRGLSRAALGQQIGISGEAVRLIENGGGMKPATREKLATILDLKVTP